MQDHVSGTICYYWIGYSLTHHNQLFLLFLFPDIWNIELLWSIFITQSQTRTHNIPFSLSEMECQAYDSNTFETTFQTQAEMYSCG